MTESAQRQTMKSALFSRWSSVQLHAELIFSFTSKKAMMVSAERENRRENIFSSSLCEQESSAAPGQRRTVNADPFYIDLQLDQERKLLAAWS